MSNTQVLAEQASEVVAHWYEKALNQLVTSGRIALNDDIWATDRYSDIVFARAQEMYEDSFF